MFWIGLTGGIGSGKSTVSDLLRKKGVEIVDADQIAHQLLHSDPDVHLEVRRFFGDLVFDENGQLDRSRLSAIVFQKPDQLSALEQIIHPRLQKAVATRRAQLSNDGQYLAFYDVPLLFEKSLEGFDMKVLVYCTREQQILRVQSRSGWATEKITARLDSQLNIESKRQWADIIIDNTGSEKDLQLEVDEKLKQIRNQLENK